MVISVQLSTIIIIFLAAVIIGMTLGISLVRPRL